ncbi:LysM domain-containing protein [Nakamurella silvestris]|nr:LysM domain-containing protein [Nakamurella silvestris]
MTNLALISAEIERPGVKPLLQRDRKGLVTLEFTHTEVGIGGQTVDTKLQKYALLASSGYALRLSGMSGLEGRYWWIITDFQVKVVQRNHIQRITAAECSWRFKEAIPQFPPVGDPAPRPDQTSPAGASKGTSTYTVKSGDSLWAIAAKLLGSGPRYTEIAKLNNIADPNAIKVGTVLKIPAR